MTESETKARPEMMLWLNSYVPRDFANLFANRAKQVQGVDAEEWAILEAGPDHEHYWDVWSDVERYAIVTDDNGNQYTIWNDEDKCWLVPIGMEFNEEDNSWEWPEEENHD